MTATPNTAALTALLERVDAGEWWDDLPRPAVLHTDLCWKSFNGSLDAAKALHDAALPGWDMQINTYEDDSFEASVSQPLQVKTYDGVSPFMARAWLLAILRALAAIKEPKT